VTKLRYGRIILLMDADSDGHHITTLLLTFFYRTCQGCIERARLHRPAAALPHRRRQGDVLGRSTTPRARPHPRKLPKNAKPEISRFKGLGEMPAEDLKATTLDPRSAAAPAGDDRATSARDRADHERADGQRRRRHASGSSWRTRRRRSSTSRRA
jgi:DNA gyrase/topoisomerase IV subunit B